jgi:hypothetical protein
VRLRAPTVVRLERTLAHNNSQYGCQGSRRAFGHARATLEGVRLPTVRSARCRGQTTVPSFRSLFDNPRCHVKPTRRGDRDRMCRTGCSGGPGAVSVPPLAFPDRPFSGRCPLWRCRQGPSLAS